MARNNDHLSKCLPKVIFRKNDPGNDHLRPENDHLLNDHLPENDHLRPENDHLLNDHLPENEHLLQ